MAIRRTHRNNDIGTVGHIANTAPLDSNARKLRFAAIAVCLRIDSTNRFVGIGARSSGTGAQRFYLRACLFRNANVFVGVPINAADGLELVRTGNLVCLAYAARDNLDFRRRSEALVAVGVPVCPTDGCVLFGAGGCIGAQTIERNFHASLRSETGVAISLSIDAANRILIVCTTRFVLGIGAQTQGQDVDTRRACN
jgi:hypothetical protein